MNFLLWILFGGIVGWIASLIMGTDAQQGIWLNILVGIGGAIIGGWIMSMFGVGAVTGFNLYNMLVALLGSIVLIGIVRAFRKM